MSQKQSSNRWLEAMRTLEKQFGGDWLHPAVAKLLATGRVRRILVACSGGADSVALLCLLRSQASILEVELVVGHYNHRWRGEASTADARFVRALAAALGCDYTSAVRPAKEAAFTETTARGLRLEFLRTAAAQHGCDAIAFGHQQDDILETQLQRLARGSGTEGLAAPRAVHWFEDKPLHIRPLLHLRAGDIRMALNAARIDWREDRSNEDLDIARNALRHQIIPALDEAMGRDMRSAAARTRQLMEEDAAALDGLARQSVPEAFEPEPRQPLDRAQLLAAPRALMRRAVVAWLARNALMDSSSAAAVDLLLEAIESGKARNLLSFGKAFVVLDGNALFVSFKESSAPPLPEFATTYLRAGESILLAHGGIMESEIIELDRETLDEIISGAVDPSQEAYLQLQGDSTSFEIRSWEPGDRFRPLGAPGTKKLADWFANRRIPQKERKRLPVVLSETGEILWVPGLPPAESHKITTHTKKALRLTYQRRKAIFPA